jgi:phospho-N-acetylmuramoyl-pentapeptide-transferase
MGGTVMLLGIVAGYLVTRVVFRTVTAAGVSLLLATLLFGALGFFDDFVKVRRRRSLGLSKTAKSLGQAVVAVAFGIFVVQVADVSTSLSFVRETALDLGVLFYLWVFVILWSSSNGVNLTDGLDGLAISTFAIAAAAYTALAYVTGHRVLAEYLLLVRFAPAAELTIFCGSLVGASLGFLWYNSYPAEVFMGDVGSLALGGALGTVAILIKQELLLLVVGGVFVLEAASVILQVASFRLTGQRVFRMAPLHHHFELVGWSEPKVITRFVILGIIFALFSLTTLKLR